MVRRIARSDHCRCVSTPRCRVLPRRWPRCASAGRTSAGCASGRPSQVGAQESLRLELAPGSRTRTQRIGTTGRPGWYQTAMPETMSTARSPPPYQSARRSAARACRPGRALLEASAPGRPCAAAGRSAWPPRRRRRKSPASRRKREIHRPAGGRSRSSPSAAKLVSVTTIEPAAGQPARSCSKRLPGPVE